MVFFFSLQPIYDLQQPNYNALLTYDTMLKLRIKNNHWIVNLHFFFSLWCFLLWFALFVIPLFSLLSVSLFRWGGYCVFLCACVCFLYFFDLVDEQDTGRLELANETRRTTLQTLTTIHRKIELAYGFFRSNLMLKPKKN